MSLTKIGVILHGNILINIYFSGDKFFYTSRYMFTDLQADFI